MTELPWNRFGEPPEEEEELPYVPPRSEPLPETQTPSPPVPPLPGVVDWEDLIDDAWPVIKEQVVGYVRGTIAAGFDVDHAHPTVTAETATGRELVVADAKSRSWRTLAQGLIFDVFAAIAAAIALLSGADLFVKETWIAFGILVSKSVVSAIISYVMRLRVTPTMRLDKEKVAVMPVPRPLLDKDG